MRRHGDLERIGDGSNGPLTGRPVSSPPFAARQIWRSSNGSLAQAARGQLDGALPGAGHRAGVLRGFDLTRVLRRSSVRRSSSGLVERRAGWNCCRATAATSPRRSRWPTPRWSIVRDMRGQGAGLPQHLPPPGQQAGVERLSPRGDRAAACRQFTCKYHGWRYDLDGRAHLRPAGGRVLRPRQVAVRSGPRALRRWEGFIFINLAKEPEQSP